ncbi:unnamed protein product [Microthlaspi erraticum]|uniref:F-box associated beta-propeller type 3 domain-containing protein n=1 Tax=Microthlaspi erraticum TaxID=1685480 RepID=A0A6D2HNH1_9BRAS|nr:unnamed protein product [Microthlaspi erraticum]
MNGVLYYLAWTDSYTCVLVSFDARSEEFEMLQVPRKAGDVIIASKIIAEEIKGRNQLNREWREAFANESA